MESNRLAGKIKIRNQIRNSIQQKLIFENNRTQKKQKQFQLSTKFSYINKATWLTTTGPKFDIERERKLKNEMNLRPVPAMVSLRDLCSNAPDFYSFEL